MIIIIEKNCRWFEKVMPEKRGWQVTKSPPLNTSLHANKYKKQRCYRENRSLFFHVIKNGHIFSSKICHFQSDHKFLFSREMENIRVCKEARLQTFRLSGKYLFYIKNEGSFGKSFSFLCFAKCFDRDFKYFLLYFKYCTLTFRNIMKFEDSKHFIFSINFFNSR